MSHVDDRVMIVARLRAACELYALGLAMMRQTFSRECPTANSTEIDQRLLDWRLQRSDAPYGDGVGRVVPFPRPRQ